MARFDDDSPVNNNYFSDEDMEEAQRMFDEGAKATKPFSLLITPKDIRFKAADQAPNVFRILSNKFEKGYFHNMPPKGYPQFCCAGDFEILSDKTRQPAMDPKNCPVCRYIIEHGLDQGTFPQPRFFFIVIDREFAKERLATGQDNIARVLQMSAKQYNQLMIVADDDDRKVEWTNPQGRIIKVMNLTRYDIQIDKVKTGADAKKVEYTLGGKIKINDLTAADRELLVGLPEDFLSRYTKPITQEAFSRWLNKGKDDNKGFDEPDPCEPEQPKGGSRVTRNTPNQDSVPLGD